MLPTFSFWGANHEWNLYGHLGCRCRFYHLGIPLGRSHTREEKAAIAATAKKQKKQVTALT